MTEGKEVILSSEEKRRVEAISGSDNIMGGEELAELMIGDAQKEPAVQGLLKAVQGACKAASPLEMMVASESLNEDLNKAYAASGLQTTAKVEFNELCGALGVPQRDTTDLAYLKSQACDKLADEIDEKGRAGREIGYLERDNAWLIKQNQALRTEIVKEGDGLGGKMADLLSGNKYQQIKEEQTLQAEAIGTEAQRQKQEIATIKGKSDARVAPLKERYEALKCDSGIFSEPPLSTPAVEEPAPKGLTKP